MRALLFPAEQGGEGEDSLLLQAGREKDKEEHKGRRKGKDEALGEDGLLKEWEEREDRILKEGEEGEDSILEDWMESREQLGRVEGEAKVLMGKWEEGEEVINGSREGEKQYKPVFPEVIWAPGLEAPPLATFISPCPGLYSTSLG